MPPLPCAHFLHAKKHRGSSSAVFGLVIGWNTRALTCCVLDVVYDASEQQRERPTTSPKCTKRASPVLMLIAVTKAIDRLWTSSSNTFPSLPSTKPQVLGVIVKGDSTSDATAHSPPLPHTDFWLRLVAGGAAPRVQEIIVCSHRQYPSSHVFIYDEQAAQAAAIVASAESTSASVSDYCSVTRQMAARASILHRLQVDSPCSWIPQPLFPEAANACLPLPLRFVAVCTAVLVHIINTLAALLPVALRSLLQRSHIGQLLCLRCSSIINSPFIMPSCTSAAPPPLSTRISRHRLLSLSFLLLIDFALGFFWVHNAPSTLAATLEYIEPGYRYALGAQGAAKQVKYWLMGNPAGFKLNDHLSATASSACIHVLDLWLHAHSFFGDFATAAVAFVLRWGGGLGLSFVIACALDFSNIACAWVLLLHTAFQTINCTLSSISASLFRLFRGKKWNPLRKRVDSCDASVDQWLLGTLAFSVLLFLMPTILSFHLFFAIMRTILWAAQLPLECALFILTETPVYPLMCRIMWPQQLCCSLFLRKLSASSSNQGASAADLSTAAAVFALEAGCEGWDDVLKEVMCKAKREALMQLLRLKVRASNL